MVENLAPRRWRQKDRLKPTLDCTVNEANLGDWDPCKKSPPLLSMWWLHYHATPKRKFQVAHQSSQAWPEFTSSLSQSQNSGVSAGTYSACPGASRILVRCHNSGRQTLSTTGSWVHYTDVYDIPQPLLEGDCGFHLNLCMSVCLYAGLCTTMCLVSAEARRGCWGPRIGSYWL